MGHQSNAGSPWTLDPPEIHGAPSLFNHSFDVKFTSSIPDFSEQPSNHLFTSQPLIIQSTQAIHLDLTRIKTTHPKPQEQNPTTTAKMPPPPPLELTLILAATRTMGIGLNGGLPWTGLKKEMAYFARVTKRVPSSSSPSPLINAVIMGRKTWDSIPPKFRPLKGRLNIVISRSAQIPTTTTEQDVVMAPSLEHALSYLGGRRDGEGVGIGKVFVIGGGEIYGAALKLKETRRILVTRVLSEFECDTFFPLVLGGEGGEEWKRSGKEGMDEWVGEEVPGGVQEEGGTEYEFQMWER